MRAVPPEPECGFSLAETLVVMAIGLVITGAAVSLMARTKQVADAGGPVIERTRTRAAAIAEMVATTRDAAAKTAYFDLARTVATVTRGTGSQPSGPPEGYCLLVLSDPETWPRGFDPHDRRTWDDVPWWEEMSRDDPSTWYYACTGQAGGGPKRVADRLASDGGGEVPPSAIPHEFNLVPVASYGTGISVGGLTLVGPAAVLPESTSLGGAQRGEALMVLRTEPGVGQFRLASPLVTTSGVVRLVARDAVHVAAIESLRAGDVLIVTGADSARTVRTSLVALSSTAEAVGAPTPATADGGTVFQTYEARIEPPDSTYAGYLSNPEATRAGAEFLADAAVALLGREGAVVTYYTAKGSNGSGLFRAVGDPTTPTYVERLVDSTVDGLRIEARPSQDPAFARPVTGVRVRVPIAAGDGTSDAEPLEADVALLNCVEARPTVRLVWDTVDLPEGGPGGGEK